MKKSLFYSIFFLLFLFIANLALAQDIIILKNGDEIKSKVIEITPELVKYKNWTNIEGPIYSSNKSDVFMIKYANGSKDVFSNIPVSNLNSGQITIANNGNKFLGVWYHKKYDGVNHSTTINISKAGEDFLVNYKVHEKVDQYFYQTDGSFKEVGHLEGSSIIINTYIKLSLIDDNTILMSSDEFVRTPKNMRINSTATQSIKKNININTGNIVNDIDGNVYHTVNIGTQIWMVENLKTTKYRNAETISKVTDNLEWINLNSGAYCSFFNDSINISKYGYLYNWYAVTDSRKIAPDGWHIPTDAEWTVLENYLISNGYNYDGSSSENKIAKALSATNEWLTFNGKVGTSGVEPDKNNSSGFSALPGGFRYGLTGKFDSAGYCGSWWSNSNNGTNKWWRIYFRRSDLFSDVTEKQTGLSVRCVKD